MIQLWLPGRSQNSGLPQISTLCFTGVGDTCLLLLFHIGIHKLVSVPMLEDFAPFHPTPWAELLKQRRLCELARASNVVSSYRSFRGLAETSYIHLLLKQLPPTRPPRARNRAPHSTTRRCLFPQLRLLSEGQSSQSLSPAASDDNTRRSGGAKMPPATPLKDRRRLQLNMP
eukprot:1901597-Amphidinium_carterae.2